METNSSTDAGGRVAIEVDSNSNDPTKAWDIMKNIGINRSHSQIQPMDPATALSQDKIRFVCISDTHGRIEKNPNYIVPDGDVLLHTGDITNDGQPHDIKQFNEYLGTLPHRYKIVIAGNHELTFDKSMNEHLHEWDVKLEDVERYLKEEGVTDIRDLLTNCIYLEDSMVTLYGINIYGTPWHPCYGHWAFSLNRGEESLQKWDLIPENTDVLLTHGPPVGYGDTRFDGLNDGCVELLNTVQKRVKPMYHIYGHIHEAHGLASDGYTTYINTSTCTIQSKPTNPPTVFDFPIPEGHSKQEIVNLNVVHFAK